MSSYQIVSGDTFELIARKVYGDEKLGLRIRRANPGVTEPLAPGAVIAIPEDTRLPLPIPLPGSNPEELQLIVGDSNEAFKYWESITFKKSIDQISAVTFSAPFDPESPEFRETFKPFSYKNTELLLGGERIFRGTLFVNPPDVQKDRISIKVTAYSRCGVIFDCMASVAVFSIEFDKQNLNDIALKLCSPFGIAVDNEAGSSPVFGKVALEGDKKIGEFLASLAKQRNRVLSANANGDLLIRQSVGTGNPVAVLNESDSPVLSIIPSFNHQNYYSDISVLSPYDLASQGGAYTARNKFANDVIRPFNFSANDTEDGNLKEAAEAKLGRMFGEMAIYQLDVETWRAPNGELWEPNTTIKLDAPSAMIYGSYEFLIKSVSFNRRKNSETASLELVLPGAYSGDQPESLPWD